MCPHVDMRTFTGDLCPNEVTVTHSVKVLEITQILCLKVIVRNVMQFLNCHSSVSPVNIVASLPRPIVEEF